LIDLFDSLHNPVFRWPLTPDAAKVLVHFWRKPDPASGALAHDFADVSRDTRFLGDLYQDLSESARKKFALLQTPEFVESFILDRTLGEALKVLPLHMVTVLDPTCGSGTTAYVAEQWGRRWIIIDTSRVAVALARSRLMGARK
jgi:SAM-dependent methyltransferase